MGRVDEVSLFWKGQDPNVVSMFLKSAAPYLDRSEKEEMISYFPDLTGKNVLELASGIGRYTRYFSEKAAHLLTVDIAPQLVDQNRRDHADCPNVTYLCSDAIDLNLPTASLDFVFANWLFMYLEDGEVVALLERINSWLRPGGELFFRESCAIQRSKSPKYYANYRTLQEYDTFVNQQFTLIKEGSIQTFIDTLADPLQGYWHCQKSRKRLDGEISL